MPRVSVSAAFMKNCPTVTPAFANAVQYAGGKARLVSGGVQISTYDDPVLDFDAVKICGESKRGSWLVHDPTLRLVAVSCLSSGMPMAFAMALSFLKVPLRATEPSLSSKIGCSHC